MRYFLVSFSTHHSLKTVFDKIVSNENFKIRFLPWDRWLKLTVQPLRVEQRHELDDEGDPEDHLVHRVLLVEVYPTSPTWNSINSTHNILLIFKTGVKPGDINIIKHTFPFLVGIVEQHCHQDREQSDEAVNQVLQEGRPNRPPHTFSEFPTNEDRRYLEGAFPTS